jgi:peptide chain release factor 2
MLCVNHSTRRLEARLLELNTQLADPKLYEHANAATKLLQEQASTQAQLSAVAHLSNELLQLMEMHALAAQEQEGALLLECVKSVQSLRKQADKMRIQTLLSSSGKAAQASAYMDFAAGAGGAEAADWAGMLFRMYSRWAVNRSFSVRTTSCIRSATSSDGIKSATLLIEGAAYGWLSLESGVHRMVSSQSGKRHTSFCQVQVYPLLDNTLTLSSIQLPASELRIETMRSQGAGGQHVNTTDSAVRITHVPTGTVAVCQDERSQHRNKEVAMQQLRGKLFAKAQQERLAAQAEQRAALGDNGWGSQIRSYVFAPYQMVKDHRTGEETADISSVLDGDIDAFIEAALSNVHEAE